MGSSKIPELQEEDAVSPSVEQMIVDGLKSIFERLVKVEEKISEVSVQKNEIGHINQALLSLKETDEDLDARLSVTEVACIKNHNIPGRRTEDPEEGPIKKDRPLLEQAWRTAIVSGVSGAILLVFSILGFVLFTNASKFFDFQKTQVNADHALPGATPAPEVKK